MCKSSCICINEYVASLFYIIYFLFLFVSNVHFQIFVLILDYKYHFHGILEHHIHENLKAPSMITIVNKKRITLYLANIMYCISIYFVSFLNFKENAL